MQWLRTGTSRQASHGRGEMAQAQQVSMSDGQEGAILPEPCPQVLAPWLIARQERRSARLGFSHGVSKNAVPKQPTNDGVQIQVAAACQRQPPRPPFPCVPRSAVSAPARQPAWVSSLLAGWLTARRLVST